MAERYTKRQGEYLAFIHLYTMLNKRPPAEADFQEYFRTSSSAVHQMIATLERLGLIVQTSNQPRSIRLLIPTDQLPDIDGTPHTSPSEISFAKRYPHITFWITKQGTIELGYDPYTDSCARAIDAGGMIWSGGDSESTIEEWLHLLDTAIGTFMTEQGLGLDL